MDKESGILGHVIEIDGTFPRLADNVFVAPSATVIGRVSLERGSSVWYNSVLRGDTVEIIIGEDSNIQDNSTLHSDPGLPLTIGNRVTIGHNCVLHGCRIDDGATIGIGSIILDGAEIGAGALIAAGSLVPPGKTIPPGSLAMGVPAKVVRQLTEEEIANFNRITLKYRDRAQRYIQEYSLRRP